MSGISDNEDGSINIDITEEEWNDFVKEQEEFEAKFRGTFEKAMQIIENGGDLSDIYNAMMEEDKE